MKRIGKIIIAAIFSVAAAAPSFAGDLTVTLTDVQAQKGDLYVSLQKQGEFMQPRGSYGAIIKAPKSGEQKVTLKDVAPGDYSIAVWHDSDADGKFSQAANGIPLDGWTMVNAQNLRGVPTWDQVKFVVPSDNVATTLMMIYPRK